MKHRLLLLPGFVLALALPFQALRADTAMPDAATPGGWDTAAAIAARIREPQFPDRDFPVTAYGAAAGGVEDCTAAIARAVAACHDAGGGRVIVPEGVFLTGPIHLRSNVNLHLSAGATLRFRTDPEACLPVVFTRWEGIECMNYSPLIYAFGQENVAVTGPGTLDGGASDDNWWKWARRPGKGQPAPQRPDVLLLNELSEKGVPVEQRVFGEGHLLRTNFIQPYRCRNVLIEGVTILRSPMWEIHPVLCTGVTVRGVTISSHGPNNDGCDPESCRDVLIEDCTFDTGDDCIAIKSGRNDDGRRIGVASENIIIRNCRMKDGHGGVVMGSEIAGGCRNVFVEDCVMDSPNLERALRFKSNARRGGVIENVFARRIEVGRVAEAFLTVDLLYEEGADGPHRPVVRNIVAEEITSRSSPRVLYIAGFPGAVIDGIRISRSTFAGVEQTEVVRNAGRIEFDRVDIIPAKPVRSLSSRPAQPGQTAPDTSAP